jgi:hypothetical protein
MISLKNILFINGASSGMTSIGLIAFPGMISEVFQVAQPSVFMGVGIFLLAFAAIVLFEAGRSQISAKKVQLIIALDILWVVASVITVLMMLETITAIGNFLILAVALWVGAMAYFQFKGLRQITV